MLKLFVIVVVCCLSMVKEANADSVSMTQAINFGNVRISNTQSSAVVTVGSDGAYGTMNNIATSSGQSNGVMQYRAEGWALIINQVTANTTATGSLTCSTAATCSGCNVTLDNMVVNPTSQSITRVDNNKKFNYGGRLTIPANCGYGTFTGSLTVTYNATIAGSVSGTLSANLVIEPQPVSVQSTQDLSFGAVLSTATHDVVISPNGSRQSSAYVVNDSSYPPTNGIIKISKEETGSRSVSVAVDNAMVMNYGNTSLNVSLTTSPEASSITSLTQTDTYINVGGTLHVVQGAPSGEYTGTYNIVVTY